MSATALGWDHPDTARYWARFQRRFARYRQANRHLVRHAALAPGMRVLDVAAGDGGTAAEVLSRVGGEGAVVCFEPAAAMRELGRRSLRDPRVTWTATWPAGEPSFDRVVCGAGIWQLKPLGETFRLLFHLLRPGGCLSFDVPALYLGAADPPGGGSDPWLMELPAAVAGERGAWSPEDEGSTATAPPDDRTGSPGSRPAIPAIDAGLSAAGFRARRWSFTLRFGQRAYREWLKIPPTTDRLLRGLTADERASLIDRAFGSVDPSSWRRERWFGWTAWKPPA